MWRQGSLECAWSICCKRLEKSLLLLPVVVHVLNWIFYTRNFPNRYYGCIIMVDLFQFKNIYAVKMEMMRLTEDVALQNECVSYVTLPGKATGLSGSFLTLK